MHTVMWTFKVPTGTSKAQLIETINATAHTYEESPALSASIMELHRTALHSSASISGKARPLPTHSTRPIGSRW